ncbi:MAG TPA: PHP domain-containing protein [bacterium]|nr:PHP domain-containing protein [bacterium]HPP12306.1 PHP domain-containing protein [bacterium]
MRITLELHLHSRHSCDTRKGTMEQLTIQAAAPGIEKPGFADHLHTPFNLPDLFASREEFLSLRTTLKVHFGCEVSCVSQWELDEIAAGRATTSGIRGYSVNAVED